MHKNIYDYIKQNMEHFQGEFAVVVTDLSEKEPGAVLLTIHPVNKNGETVDFIMHKDGREEYTTSI